MYYSSNPVADAERYYDEQDARAERAEAVMVDWQDEIKGGFDRLAGLPYIDGRTGKVRHQAFEEAAGDLIADDGVFAAFLKVMRNSKDPAVTELRKVMQAKYESQWLDDLVEFSVSR